MEQGGVHQSVVHHHVGLLQRAQALDGNKAGVAGAGAHQENFAGQFVHLLVPFQAGIVEKFVGIGVN